MTRDLLTAVVTEVDALVVDVEDASDMAADSPVEVSELVADVEDA